MADIEGGKDQSGNGTQKRVGFHKQLTDAKPSAIKFCLNCRGAKEEKPVRA